MELQNLSKRTTNKIVVNASDLVGFYRKNIFRCLKYFCCDKILDEILGSLKLIKDKGLNFVNYPCDLKVGYPVSALGFK